MEKNKLLFWISNFVCKENFLIFFNLVVFFKEIKYKYSYYLEKCTLW